MNQMFRAAAQFARLGFLILCAYACMANADAQTPCTRIAEFGSAQVCLPPMPNHHECLKNAVSEMLADGANAPGNVMLGMYLNEPLFQGVSYLENAPMNDPAWDSFDSIPFEDYFLVYATNVLAGMKVDTMDLRYMASMTTGAFEISSWEKMKTIIDEKLDGTTMSRPKLLEHYQPHPAVRSMVLLLNYQSEEGKQFWKVSVINMMVIDERLIDSAYYLFFKDQSTIEAAKAHNEVFVKKFMEANR